VAEHRVPEGVVRIDRQRLLAGGDRAPGGLDASEIALHLHPGAVHERPGVQVPRVRAPGVLDLGAAQRGLERRHDGLRHLVVHLEDALELAVEALGPGVGPRRGVDELRGHAHAVTREAHAALEHVAHAELSRDLLHVHRLPLVGEARVARDHEELLHPGESGDDVLGEAVGQVLVGGIAREVGEGQDCNRRPVDDERRVLRPGLRARGVALRRLGASEDGPQAAAHGSEEHPHDHDRRGDAREHGLVRADPPEDGGEQLHRILPGLEDTAGIPRRWEPPEPTRVL
jgi:hypothetical protein